MLARHCTSFGWPPRIRWSAFSVAWIQDAADMDTWRVGIDTTRAAWIHDAVGIVTGGCCQSWHPPAITRHRTNVWSMLAHRLRRWPSIGQTLVECLVFVVRLNTAASSRKASVLHKTSGIRPPNIARKYCIGEQRYLSNGKTSSYCCLSLIEASKTRSSYC